MKAGFGDRVRAAVASIHTRYRPRSAVVLGSGLSGIVEGLGWDEVPFASIAEFPVPTVQGHRGILCLSADAAIMAGRFHYYEGHSMDDVVLPIFVLRELGVETLILTNAAGGANPGFKPGDLVLISDHVNLMGTNPFIGPNPSRPLASSTPNACEDCGPWGERFFDMTTTYPAELRALARKVAGKELREGVYAAFSGPSYETPAEVRMARALGADLVGMSTVPEAIAARHLGMRVLGISCVTNMAAGISESALRHDEVVAAGKGAEADLRRLVLGLLERL